MHDAYWRSSFGGKIYKTNGSHGCINLPPAVAKTVYENISAGMPVLCYHLQGSGSGTTSTTAQNGGAAAAETKPQQTQPAQTEYGERTGKHACRLRPAHPGSTSKPSAAAQPSAATSANYSGTAHYGSPAAADYGSSAAADNGSVPAGFTAGILTVPMVPPRPIRDRTAPNSTRLLPAVSSSGGPGSGSSGTQSSPGGPGDTQAAIRLRREQRTRKHPRCRGRSFIKIASRVDKISP